MGRIPALARADVGNGDLALELAQLGQVGGAPKAVHGRLVGCIVDAHAMAILAAGAGVDSGEKTG